MSLLEGQRKRQAM